MPPIYLDNNATTPVLPAVWEAMRPYFGDGFGNPASAHAVGRRARQAVEDARDRIARLLDAFPDEVVFTSGATEANNLAIFGLAGEAPGRIVSSPIEHPSVAEPVAWLQQRGYSVAFLAVDSSGIVSTESWLESLRAELRLATVMCANHETGSVQPISVMTAQLRNGFFHCDAVQAVGKIPVRFHDLGVTTLSLSAHKFHGPPGIGALLVRRGTQLRPLTLGGPQQQGRRPGTEPAALIVGMARALELACDDALARTEQVQRLRAAFLGVLNDSHEPFAVNGPSAPCAHGLPHTLNVSFPGCPADALLMNLDLAGVACSTGSACSSGSLLPSPVLRAMAVPQEILHSAMRFSFSHLLTEAEVVEAACRLVEVVQRLRRTRQ